MTRTERIAQIVTTPGTIVKPTFDGHVVVVDGRTGRDACEPTADKAFDVLLKDEVEQEERSEAEPTDEAVAPSRPPRPLLNFTEKLGEFPSEELLKERHETNERRAAAKGL